MKINLRVEYTDGSAAEATASAADLVAFETKFEIAVTNLEQNMKYTYLLWLAWHSLFRKKVTDKDFDSWVDLVESVAPSDLDPKLEG